MGTGDFYYGRSVRVLVGVQLGLPIQPNVEVSMTFSESPGMNFCA